MMKSRELKKALYQALKIETRKRKFKLSAEHNIYKKDGEYLPDLAIRILDYIEGYYKDFMEKVDEEYGGLDGWYIANKETSPLLASLTYFDKGDMNHALECFSHPNMGGSHSLWSSVPDTEEQLARALANGYNAKFKYFDRSTKQRFEDYVTTMKKGLEWTSDKAKFGLLPEER